MPFERPISIREAMDKIARREYVLPAIQREFVWKPTQIVSLFDSLLRGYPIGSFLFWQVTPEKRKDFQFYEFLRDYHERDATHNPKANPTGDGGITAVLDGQQRLTSIYIGVLGTYAERKKRARKRYDANYPKTRLYLNLSAPLTNGEATYDFRFREDTEDFTREGAAAWYRVGHIMRFGESVDILDFLITNRLVEDTYPKSCLARLYKAVMEQPVVNFYNETDQDLDKVLNIFIRVNSGGTELSYSDLLLSIATAQWESLDAREEIHALVDQINRDYGDGFTFSRDFVLKSCLMLADLDLRGQVGNFNRANMKAIEILWPTIANSIRLTVRLLASFGFSGSTLASANAVIPIVYYLFLRNNPEGYSEAAIFKEDREVVKRWLNVVLLKQTFGGVPDNVLRPIRQVIRQQHDQFPLAGIADALKSAQQSIDFDVAELDALLDAKYGGTYTFPVLALLYPDLDFRNRFHQDHIHPRAGFSESRLRKSGIPETEWKVFMDNVDRIPNLQLLEGQPNIEKSDCAFETWFRKHYANDQVADLYRARNLIPPVDLGFSNFIHFYAARKQLLLNRLRTITGASDVTDQIVADPELRADFHGESVRLVSRNLGLDLVSESQTQYASRDGKLRLVCAVSKAYARTDEARFWFAFYPRQAEYLSAGDNAFVAFGCGGPEHTILLGWPEFEPLLDGMRMTEDPKRRYWHIEIFAQDSRWSLDQSLLGRRIDVSDKIIRPR
jgi:hypothetical protein